MENVDFWICGAILHMRLQTAELLTYNRCLNWSVQWSYRNGVTISMAVIPYCMNGQHRITLTRSLSAPPENEVLLVGIKKPGVPKLTLWDLN